MGTFSLETLAIVFVVGILIFIVLREVNCWYWKINKRVELQEETNYLLKKLVERIEKRETSISEQTSVNDPKVMEEMLRKIEKKNKV